MMKKLLFTVLIISLSCATTFGQTGNFGVASFTMDEKDQAARIISPRKDQNDKVCAIVKMETPLLLKDFIFDAGMTAVAHTEQKTNEIWIYLSPGARRLTIQHKHVGTIRNYEFGETLKEATVYIMKLKSGTVKTVVEEDVNMQYLVVNCPIDRATIKIDNDAPEPFTNGKFQKLLEYGKHQYIVEAPLYKPLAGKVELTAQKKEEVNAVMQPNFATLTFTADGDIYINDVRKATDKWTDKFSPGTYKVEVKKEAHRSSVVAVTVKAGENKTIPLQVPTPIVGSLNISSNVVGASIFIDGAKHSETTPILIKGMLIGKHDIQLQHKDYKPMKKTVEKREGKLDIVKITLQEKDKYGQNPTDFLPKEYVVFEKINGDLNKDGIEDCVLIIKGTDKNQIITDRFNEQSDRNRRGIIVLLNKNELYELAAKNYDCFSSENEDGGPYVAPDLHVYIEKGNLYIRYGHGKYGYWKYTFRFHNSDFELIGYDQSDNRGPVVSRETSINFLSKKKQEKVNINEDAEESGDEVFKETWKSINVNRVIKLSEVKDFDELDMTVY
ncbi:hypothetical protein FACS1894199_16940 [Bacteroidia bacterium]|nr:hypothetical protein FACS1894199_16940 [Bacteroidia bacterium]